MSLDQPGENTKMRGSAVICFFLIVVLISACSKQEVASQKPVSEFNDTILIQAAMDTTLERLRYLDKSVLYEQEFEYLQEKVSFDEYMNYPQIRPLYLDDSLVSVKIARIELFNRDSAHLEMNILYVGPKGDTSIDLQKDWQLYYQNGRWIRPSVSKIAQQIEFEKIKRAADSAAAAEEESGGS